MRCRALLFAQTKGVWWEQVPGEMFELAMAAKRERDMGVVGSTQNILDFITSKLAVALEQPFPDRCAVLCLSSIPAL